MTVYHSQGASEPPVPATSDQIPALRRRRRALRIVLLVVAIALLVNVLLIKAYTSQGHGSDGLKTKNAARRLGAGGGPRRRDGGRPARRPAPLVPDAGPDDRADLRRRPRPDVDAEGARRAAPHHVPATFFVVGSQVARHPGAGPADGREGHELGIHTFTHPELAETCRPGGGSWSTRRPRRRSPYATGVITPLLRPPYSSVPTRSTTTAGRWCGRPARRGYVSVFNDTDSQDWARPGVPTRSSATPPRQGAGARSS